MRYFDTKRAYEILSDNQDRIITVHFIKKDGTLRILNGRVGVKKYVKGIGLPYDPNDYDLFVIYDMVLASKTLESERHKCYRMISMDKILEFHIAGEVIRP